MAKTTGITMYECDRCGAKEHLTKDSPATADWHDIERVTKDGARRPVLLCKECHATYLMLVEQEDTDFNNFMAKGRE